MQREPPIPGPNSAAAHCCSLKNPRGLTHAVRACPRLLLRHPIIHTHVFQLRDAMCARNPWICAACALCACDLSTLNLELLPAVSALCSYCQPVPAPAVANPRSTAGRGSSSTSAQQMMADPVLAGLLQAATRNGDPERVSF